MKMLVASEHIDTLRGPGAGYAVLASKGLSENINVRDDIALHWRLFHGLDVDNLAV